MSTSIRKGSPVRARVNGILAAAIVQSVSRSTAEVVLKVGSKNHTVPYDLSKFQMLTRAEFNEYNATQDFDRIEAGTDSKVVLSQRIFIEEMKADKAGIKADGFRQRVIARYRADLELTDDGAETYFYNANRALVRQDNV